MKSPKQATSKSTPKHVTLEGGIKLPMPMYDTRCTPTKKTMPKLYPGAKCC
jgi:hypothetical protein